eukprot:m.249035 g.249035  ORF g.249035 m.249035 type:complete len:51 (+) comp64219_c0_seq1:48-200(+)
MRVSRCVCVSVCVFVYVCVYVCLGVCACENMYASFLFVSLSLSVFQREIG